MNSSVNAGFALLALGWFSTILVGCAGPARTLEESGLPLSQSFVGRQSECVPRFPDDAGWYGGDAAYSVPLPVESGRVSLWLFGDSFVQRPNSPESRSYPFVHNSIGLSYCEPGGEWRLDTFWRRDGPGEPRAFFEPDSAASWVRQAVRETGVPPYYWLFDGFVAHDVLFIGLLRIIHSEPRGPFNLPFRLAGMDLARVENYRDAPENWRIQISTLSHDPVAFPGSTFVATTSHLYAFAFFDRGDGRAPRMLSRLDLRALVDWQADLSNELEYFSKNADWKAGFDPQDAMILMHDDASEMSVHFDVKANSWIAVYSDLARDSSIGGSNSVLLRRAQSLVGPWTEPQPLFAIPETIADSSGKVDENLFCYAGKAHPQFALQGELLVTYVCNLYARNAGEASSILRRLRDSPDLYRPRAVKVELPPIESEHGAGVVMRRAASKKPLPQR